MVPDWQKERADLIIERADLRRQVEHLSKLYQRAERESLLRLGEIKALQREIAALRAEREQRDKDG